MAAAKVQIDSRFRQFKGELEQGARKALARTADKTAGAAKTLAPRDSGTLAGSIRRTATVKTRTGYRVDVRADAFYALFLELGTRGRRRRKVSAETLRRRNTPSGRRRAASARGGGIKPRRFLGKALRLTGKGLIVELGREFPG